MHDRESDSDQTRGRPWLASGSAPGRRRTAREAIPRRVPSSAAARPRSATAVRSRHGERLSPARHGSMARSQRCESQTSKALDAGGAVALPTLSDAAKQWRESRIDVGEQTPKLMHRSAFVRIFEGSPRVAEPAASTTSPSPTLRLSSRHLPPSRTGGRRSERRAPVSPRGPTTSPSTRTRYVTIPGSSCRRSASGSSRLPLADHVERVAETQSRPNTSCRS